MPRVFMVWLLLASTIGWGVYQLKYEVQRLEKRLTAINREILKDQRTIQIMVAEWSYLNRPQHIEALGRRLLELEPVTGRQFVTLEDLPNRGHAMPVRPGIKAQPAPLPPDLDADDPPTHMPFEELGVGQTNQRGGPGTTLVRTPIQPAPGGFAPRPVATERPR
jgi:hypothetical protein